MKTINNKGFTFFELLISMAIISIMSSVFWINLHPDDRDLVERETERMAAKIRKVRSMALARVPDPTLGEFPEGGYGIQFYNEDPVRYIIYADTAANNSGYSSFQDVVLETATLPEDIADIVPLGSSINTFHVAFKGANEINTNIPTNVAAFYAIGLVAGDQRGNIRLGEETEDGYQWANMGISYDTIDPADPSEGGGGGKNMSELGNPGGPE